MKKLFLIIVCVFCILACTQNKSDSSVDIQISDSQEVGKTTEINAILSDSSGHSLELANMDQNQKMTLISADWLAHFPVPDNTWGYTFENDGKFDYVNNSKPDLIKRYRFTNGIWKLNGNELQVQLTSYTKADRDPIVDAIGFRFPDDTKFIKVTIDDEEWHTIGDLSDVVEKQFKGGIEFPIHLPLRTILFDQILEANVIHFRYSSQ